MFGWLRKRQKERAFGEHIQALANEISEKNKVIDRLLREKRLLRTQTWCDRYSLETIDGLLNIIDSLLYGDNKVTRKPDDFLFNLIFTTDQRVVIKRALNLLEERGFDNTKMEKTTA